MLTPYGWPGLTWEASSSHLNNCTIWSIFSLRTSTMSSHLMDQKQTQLSTLASVIYSISVWHTCLKYTTILSPMLWILQLFCADLSEFVNIYSITYVTSRPQNTWDDTEWQTRLRIAWILQNIEAKHKRNGPPNPKETSITNSITQASKIKG